MLTRLKCLGTYRGTVESLDGRTITFDTRNISPIDNTKIIPGEGMINTKKGTRGDLKISFVIDISNISNDQKSQICNILRYNGSSSSGSGSSSKSR